MIKKALILVVAIIFMVGCEGPEGPMGPTGPAGPAGPAGPIGPAGVALIKTYSGTIYNVNTTFSIPEIFGKEGTTFILAYWAFAEAPTAWIQATDGWIDDAATAHVFITSWATGQVILFGWVVGDKYKINIYGTD